MLSTLLQLNIQPEAHEITSYNEELRGIRMNPDVSMNGCKTFPRGGHRGMEDDYSCFS